MLLPITLLSEIPALSIQAKSHQRFLNRQEEHFDSIGFFFLDEFGYTFDIGGEQIFPNDRVKRSIVT
jgi:hypothetical protein